MSSSASSPFAAEPYDYAEARRIADDLGLADPVAITLVRRGHRTPEQARAFIEADVVHDPDLFAGIGEAVATIRAAIGRCERVTVHGDYDVDGICSTAILVAALRRAGAECDWIIPDRLSEGYGLSDSSVSELRRRGSGLLITVDCGIGSVAEVEEMLAAGIEVVVTDHHQPGGELPPCPIVHPSVSGYPFEGLCGTAIAHKLVAALERELGGAGAPGRDLDLVALATIADLVPLVDENRTLARRGLAELRKARRPGVRALLEVASVVPERLDEGDVAFRLAPRLNAAGRLYRADAGVELMLTSDPERARSIAAELDSANHERRETERGVLHQAEAAFRALPDEQRSAPALVLAGDGWHPGVVGIVASRVVERHGRPAIVLSVDEDGRARGSGRSVPGFDLLAALDACSHLLDRYGGHRAAAGVELEASRIPEFRAALGAHARAVVPEQGAGEPERIDAVVGADALDLRVAEQFERLAPFGQGNPDVRLLVPSASISDVRPMGQEGKHARFNLGTASGTLSARGVAFNANGALAAAQRTPHDLTVRLEVNHWNGAVEPRAVLAAAHGRAERVGGDDPLAAAEHRCADGETPPWWWRRFDAELDRDLPEPGAESLGLAGANERSLLDARRGSAVARISELLSSGARVMAVSADAGRRAGLAATVGPAFGGTAATVCLRCSPDALLAGSSVNGLSFLHTDWSSLNACPAAALGFEHLVLVDPPPGAAAARLVHQGSGGGYAHEAWGPSAELAELCWEGEWELRPALAEIYRELAARTLEGEALAAVLRGPSRFARSPESAARCARVLLELGIAAGGGSGNARRLGVVSSGRTELERSRAWRAYASVHEEGLRYLQSRRAQGPRS